MGLMPAALRDIELVTVGTHAAGTGRTVVTDEDLADMLAAESDGLVDHAPVKLGHFSKLNDELELGDGAPAYGWVKPTRIGPREEDGKATLFGDVIGMPSALAAVVPTAYRRRSVEIEWNLKTVAGKTYKAAIIGLALLGASAPAVKGLKDVVALFSEDPAERGARSDVLIVEGLVPAAVAMLSAAADAGATPDQLDAMATAAGAHDTADVPPLVDETTNDEVTQTPGTPPTTSTGDTNMPITDEQLRKLLKVEADADLDAAVTAAITALDAPAEPVVDPAAPAAVVDPAAPAAPELVGAGVAQLSAANLAELQRDAAWARDQRRAQVLDGAIRAGKLAPSERSAFAARLEADEEGTTSLITSLAPRFAVSELGADSAPVVDEAAVAAESAAWDSFESQTFGLGN